MAASKSNFHVRSNSFPSDSHPLLQRCNEHLERLASSDTTSSSSSSSISNKLSAVNDLLDCVEKLLQSKFAQQAFSQGRQEKWTDQIVDGSLRLLDLCSVAKDAVLHTKECAREIQSVMRRRRGGGADQDGLEIEIKKYLASRKVVKKTVQKALRSQIKSVSVESNEDNETKALVNVLRQVETVTVSAFESLLSFIMGTKAQTNNKLGGWSLVSKLMHNKRVGSGDEQVNEFEKLDASLHCLVCHENVRSDLQNLELCVQDFEGRLDFMFRRLIKTRVSLLNILNN